MKHSHWFLPLLIIAQLACVDINFTQRTLKEAMNQRDFRLVSNIKEMPAKLSVSFFSITGIRKHDMANPGETWNGGDVYFDSIPSCALLLAGSSPNYSFVAYQTGGLMSKTNLVIFRNHDDSLITAWRGYSPGNFVHYNAADSTLIALRNTALRGEFINESTN